MNHVSWLWKLKSCQIQQKLFGGDFEEIDKIQFLVNLDPVFKVTLIKPVECWNMNMKEEKIRLDGVKITKILGRFILPIIQIVFVLIYSIMAISKWNNYHS